MRSSPSADVPPTAVLQTVQTSFLAALRAGDDLPGFVEPPAGTVESRWAIYRNGYLIRLAQAIENDYPAIARIVGEGAFHALCRRYLAAFPPRSHDIGRAGEFLATHLPTDPVASALPFLPDLARFEWALAEATVARDVDPLRWNDLAVLGPERLADTPLRAAPATALVRSAWPLDALRLAKDQADGEIDIVLEGRPSAVLVWRQVVDARWRTVDADEAAVIEGALAGWTPADSIESGAFGDGDDAPTRFVAALRRLVDQGVFAPLSHSGDAAGAPLRKETV